MIRDGVELPSLLPVERAAELAGVDSVTVLRWLREGTAQGMRIGGTQHVITDSIADRMGEATEQRPNQVDLTN